MTSPRRTLAAFAFALALALPLIVDSITQAPQIDGPCPRGLICIQTN